MTTFILKGLKLSLIDQKYGFVRNPPCGPVQSMDLAIEPIEPPSLEPIFTTRVCIDEEKQAQSFYNPIHDQHIMTMQDYTKGTGLPANLSVLCFWCRGGINNSPLGCPVRWVNHLIEKNYKSTMTKDGYTLKENVSESKLRDVFTTTHLQVSEHVNGYFQTDGLFCSFNCVYAFILDNKHNTLYKESMPLLFHLYERLTGETIKVGTPFHPAPSWRLLKEFGGPLTREEFVNSFNVVYYKYLFTIDIMRPLSQVFSKVGA